MNSDLDKFRNTKLYKIFHKEYKTREEREKRFEELIIELEQYRDSRGLRVAMPQLQELVNIYIQAENH